MQCASGMAACVVARATAQAPYLFATSSLVAASQDVSLQDSFWDRIQGARNSELGVLWRTAIVASFNAFLLNAIPVIVSVATFTAYVLLGHNLTAAKAFTALSLFTVRCLRYCRHQSRVIHPVCTHLREPSCCTSCCCVM